MPLNEENVIKVCERIATLETEMRNLGALLRGHEANANIREDARALKFQEVFQLINSRRCNEHSQALAELTKTSVSLNRRLSWLERVCWTGLGGLSVLVFALNFVR